MKTLKLGTKMKVIPINEEEDEVEVSCFGFSHDAVKRAITDYRHDIPKLLATAIAVVDQAQVQSQYGAGEKVRESLNVAKYFIASASRSVSGLQSDLKSCEQEFKASLLDEC